MIGQEGQETLCKDASSNKTIRYSNKTGERHKWQSIISWWSLSLDQELRTFIFLVATYVNAQSLQKSR